MGISREVVKVCQEKIDLSDDDENEEAEKFHNSNWRQIGAWRGLSGTRPL